MKKLLIIAALMMTTIVVAQPGKRERKAPSPELQAKKMTLALDLNASQEKQVLKILEEQRSTMEEQKLTREERQELTAKQKEDRLVALLDQKIAIKRDFKKILSDQQYEQWEKMMAKRGKQKMKKRRQRRN